MKFYTLVFILLYFITVHSQNEQDSLVQKKYSELSQKVRENINDKEKALQYARAYLTKAKKEKSQLGLATGYRLHFTIFKDENLRISYLDSAINTTLNMENKYYPALLLLYRGGIYYRQKKFKAALQDYLLANTYAKKNNEELYYTIKFNVGMIKRQIGNFREAEDIFDECLFYESNYKDFDNGKMYFGTLFQLSNIYYETEQFPKATQINSRGIIETLKREDSSRYYHFVVNEGINLTIQKKYISAIDSILKSLPHIHEKGDLAVVYHYLGTAMYESNQKEASIPYFKKVDSIFLETNDLLPSLRPTYEKLINYYRDKKDHRKQLLYTNRLLKLDSILNDDYKYLVKNLYKEYDFPELMSEKEKLIAELQEDTKEMRLLNVILVVVSVFILLGLVYYYRQKKEYKKRFNVLISNQTLQKQDISGQIVENKTVKDANKDLNDIDQETIEKVLTELEEFANNETYLKNQITLNDVAKIINTNSKYLSRIINHYHQKNFTTYINDLRVDYLVKRLKEDANFRKYTISAIAGEGGFTNALSFSRAFFKKTGLKPSYFMTKLIKEKNNVSIP